MLVATLIAVAAASVLLLLVLLITLVRHLRVVATSLGQLQEELLPVLQGLQRDAEATRQRVDRLGGEPGTGTPPG